MRDALGDQLRHVAEREDGTLVYLLYEDVANPDRLWSYERYVDEAAVEAHRPHAREAVAAVAHLLVAPPEVINARLVGGKGAD